MLSIMRTTVTLDPDTEQIVRRRMAERRMSFKEALNSAIRESAQAGGADVPFRTRTAAMGAPVASLDRALSLAADLEDEEFVRRLGAGR
jgi:acyl CoA:acetate/3-ketoacid CoA transferase alpha subunit